MAVEPAKNVYRVGVVGWALEHFHGHELSIHRGSACNSYLVKDEKTILIDTVWNAIREMTDAISEGLGEGGVPSRVFHIPTSDRNDVITEIFKAGAVVVGSSTINNSVLPTIAPILEDLKGLKFRNKVTGAFGSYGWSGESVPKIKKHLESCGLDVVGDGVAAKWQPTMEDLEACREYGREIAGKLMEEISR